MNILLDAVFLAVSFSHFGVDLLNGQVQVFLAYLSGPLGLSNTVLSAVSMVYSVSGSLSQPLFGYLADRIGPRWVVSGGVFWIVTFFSLAVTTPGPLALGFLVMASLGSGAFHPAGTMQATYVGRERFSGRETSSTSYFFLLGQTGLFLGPLLAGVILASLGPRGLLFLIIPGILVGINAVIRLKNFSPMPVEKDKSAGFNKSLLRPGVGMIVALALLAASRSWVQQNMNIFIPKYLSDLGHSPDLYGLIASLFMGGSALGNVLGGNLADRIGKRKVAVGTLILASVPLAIVPRIQWVPWMFVVIPLAGALIGATHSIVVVYAQHLFPGGMGLASGLILGFMFSSGALGTLLSGYLADQFGIPVVFEMTAVLALFAGGLAFLLRESDSGRQSANG